MPDTGAPWNIPYVESTDLVSDWPADSLALANAIADGLDDAGTAGIGSNVVSTTKTNVFSTTSSSFTNVTGLSATITPTSASSKVLVISTFMLSISSLTNAQSVYRLTRNGTAVGVGDSAGSRSPAFGAGIPWDPSHAQMVAIAYLDSPATTSATTYQIQVRRRNQTLYIGRTGTDGDANYFPRSASFITAIEVAA